jgi:hypothetical protein
MEFDFLTTPVVGVDDDVKGDWCCADTLCMEVSLSG